MVACKTLPYSLLSDCHVGTSGVETTVPICKAFTEPANLFPNAGIGNVHTCGMVCLQWTAADWLRALAAPAELVWEVGDYTQAVFGKQIPGFHYSFCLSSEAEFHTYIEQGTWEIDRLAALVTVIAARAGGVPWEMRVGTEDLFYTHEGIDFAPGENSSIPLREGLTIPEETVVWQMMPRGSGSQVFDFQAAGDGWLAVYNPVPGYIQACMRKEPIAPVIAHLERHFFPRCRGIESG